MKIDDDVPLPPLPGSRMTEYQSIINDLKVGQSFFVATDRPDSVRTLTLKCALRAGFHCTTRKWEQEGQSGIRVWRVE